VCLQPLLSNMQCACAILSSVACLPYNIFSTLSFKRHDFSKKKKLNVKRMLWFSLQVLCETFLILRRTERDVIKMVYWSLCKLLVILVRFLWKLNFLDSFSKNIPIGYQISWKRVEWVPSSMRADRRADGHDETISPFSQFCKRAHKPLYWIDQYRKDKLSSSPCSFKTIICIYSLQRDAIS
jgi:hypothetical protein